MNLLINTIFFYINYRLYFFQLLFNYFISNKLKYSKKIIKKKRKNELNNKYIQKKKKKKTLKD